jgi:hypothetical protein
MPHNKYNLDHNQLLKQLSREQLNNTKVQKEKSCINSHIVKDNPSITRVNNLIKN